MHTETLSGKTDTASPANRLTGQGYPASVFPAGRLPLPKQRLNRE
ncbi:hypothetical protein [Oxalobacter paraformigenes]|nr:hypothetical protein [Oxalobacter paraformigenes]